MGCSGGLSSHPDLVFNRLSAGMLSNRRYLVECFGVFYGCVSIAWLIARTAYILAPDAYAVAFIAWARVSSLWDVAVACLVV